MNRISSPGHAPGRRLSRLIEVVTLVVAAAFTATAATVVTAAPAHAATQVGNDISWPQCTIEQGGYGNPMPATNTGFVVLGLTHGSAFTVNPCLVEQARWVRDNYRPFHAYAFASYPTRAQIARYGTTGPFPSSTYLGKIRNVGYAEAAHAVNTLHRIGLNPPRVWIDVEHKGQPWVALPGNPTAAIYNRAVLEGMLAAFAKTKIPTGFYSNPDGWATITDNWQRPDLPFWATVGTRGQAVAEQGCAATGRNGGPVHLVQWWVNTPQPVDWNVSCPGYVLAAPKVTLSWPTISSTRSKVGHTSVVLTAGPSRRQTWQLTVTDACTGRRITQVGGVTSDKIVTTWRGRRADGTRVPPGLYRLTLKTGTRTPPTGPAYAPLHQVLPTSGTAKTCMAARALG